jgi:hypothetical protein
MKNKSFSRNPYYFFKRRIPKEPYTALVMMTPCSKLKRTKDTLENILQWEDDIDRIMDASRSTTGVVLNSTFTADRL